MSDLSNEDFLAKFERNIQYLQVNIPPDDIYIFGERMHMAACFFLKALSMYASINDICKMDPVAASFVKMVMGMLSARDKGIGMKMEVITKPEEPREDSNTGSAPTRT